MIVSENLRRRHLDAGQRALLGVAVEKHFAELAKERQGERTDLKRDEDIPANRPEPSDRRQREAREQAAQSVGASGRSVQRAKKVLSVAPDLADQVRSGELALDRAYREAQERERASTTP